MPGLIREFARTRTLGVIQIELLRDLEGKFGDDLGAVRSAMQKLATSLPPKELAEHAFGLYEEFRPSIPGGTKGWGAKGKLDLDRIEGLGNRRSVFGG